MNRCTRAAVRLGPVVVHCEVAATPAEQARGLQDRGPLADGEGMLFPFTPPRAATFHMGRVAFPIDLVFIGAGDRVAQVVTGYPGTAERWSHDRCAAVVEVPAGFCRRAGVTAGHAYNQLRLYNEAAGGAPAVPGQLASEPLSDRAKGPARSRVPPDERFEDRGLPDEANPDAMDQPEPGWRSQFGPAPAEGWDGVVGPWYRAGQLEVGDPTEFAVAVVDTAMRARLPWRAAPLSGAEVGLETAVVPAATLLRWFANRGATPEMLETARLQLTDPEARGAVADAFTLSGLCDLARPTADGGVVLTRGTL